MDTNMDVSDDSGDESTSSSRGRSRNSGGRASSSDRRERFSPPQLPTDEYCYECLQIEARVRNSFKSKPLKRLEGNPFTTTYPRRTNPVPRIGDERNGNPMAGDSQAGPSIVGFSNVAGIQSSTPFLQKVSKSSSKSSKPNLFLRQELRQMKPRHDSKGLPPQPLFNDPSLGSMIEQFQKLVVSTNQGYKRGQASPVASTSQSPPQMGPPVQASGPATTSDDCFKPIVKAALNVLGYILKALTDGMYFQINVVQISNSLEALLLNVAHAFKTVELHPNSERVFNRIGVSLFSRILMRITDVSADVRLAIQRHRTGQNFNLRERLESILEADLKMWSDVCEQILDAI